MSPISVFYIKLLLIFASSALVWWGSNADSIWEKIHKNLQKTTVLMIGILVFRLLPFIIIYLIFNEMPRGDVPFFWGKATSAFKGGLVYRDFISFHAPLFAYIIALPLLFWYSSKAIVLLMVLIEGLIVWGTYLTYKNRDIDALKSVILYLILSAPMVMVLLGGQEDIWMWGIAVWMLYHFQHTPKNGFGLGVRFSVGLLTIKATLGFWLFPLWFLFKKHWMFFAGMAVMGIVSVVFLYWLTALDFLMPLKMTSNLLTPNAFTITRPFITSLSGHTPDLPTFSWISLLFTLSAATWIGYILRHKSLIYSLPLSFLATYIAMTIFQSTSVGYYAFTYMLPLVLELVDWKKCQDVLILLFFNALLVIQPFLFTYLNSPTYDDMSVFSDPLYILEYSLQIMNVACFCWYFRKVYQKSVAR